MKWINDFSEWFFDLCNGVFAVLHMLVIATGILLLFVSLMCWGNGDPTNEAATVFTVSLYMIGSCIIPMVIFFFVNKSNNTSSLEENLECYRKAYRKVIDANAVFVNVMTDLKVELVDKSATIDKLNQKNESILNDLKQLKSIVKTINKKYN